jgi:hypothetical protein
MGIVEIEAIEVPGATAEGGARQRLLTFAQWVAGRGARIRCFADADWDRLLGRRTPDNVWLTDPRDLEGYTLRVEVLEKVLQLAAVTDAVTPDEMLREVFREGRRLGVLRLVSERSGLGLPFQRTPLRRYVVGRRGRVEVRLPQYMRALLQNGGISIARLREIAAWVDEMAAEMAAVPDGELVHGKDAFCLIERALEGLGFREGDCGKAMWTSYEKGYVKTNTNLVAVLEYLRG